LRELALELISTEVDFIPDKRYQRRNAGNKFLDANLLNPEKGFERHPSKYQSDSSELPSGVGQSRLLTPEEETGLFEQMNYAKYRFNILRSRINPDDLDRDLILDARELHEIAMATRERLIESNLRLVISISRKFVTSHMTFDDLFSDGVMALMQAVEKFDVSRGYRFSAYAYYSISRSIYRFTKKLKKNLLTVESFELNSDDDTLESSSYSEDGWGMISNRLDDMINKLDEREQWIIRQRFRFDGFGKVPTYKHLAEKLGVCNERVRQLEKRALQKLRNMDHANELDDLLEFKSPSVE